MAYWPYNFEQGPLCTSVSISLKLCDNKPISQLLRRFKCVSRAEDSPWHTVSAVKVVSIYRQEYYVKEYMSKYKRGNIKGISDFRISRYIHIQLKTSNKGPWVA